MLESKIDSRQQTDFLQKLLKKSKKIQTLVWIHTHKSHSFKFQLKLTFCMLRSQLIDMNHLNLILPDFEEILTKIESSKESGKQSLKHKLRFVIAVLNSQESNSKRLMLDHSKSTLRQSLLSHPPQRASL